MSTTSIMLHNVQYLNLSPSTACPPTEHSTQPYYSTRITIIAADGSKTELTLFSAEPLK